MRGRPEQHQPDPEEPVAQAQLRVLSQRLGRRALRRLPRSRGRWGSARSESGWCKAAILPARGNWCHHLGG
jgi:hypothetical protein